MGRRDEIEPRFGWLTTAGAALGILLLLVVLAVVALDLGDEPPRTEAVRAWLEEPDYRCELDSGASACFAVDETRVVAAGRQLQNTPGCEPES